MLFNSSLIISNDQPIYPLPLFHRRFKPVSNPSELKDTRGTDVMQLGEFPVVDNRSHETMISITGRMSSELCRISGATARNWLRSEKQPFNMIHLLSIAVNGSW